MKKSFLILLGIGALCLGAAAKEINNFLKDGFPVLIPSVQKLERTDKGFTLPLDLAVAAPEEAKYEAGLVGPMISGRFGGYKAHVVGADEVVGVALGVLGFKFLSGSLVACGLHLEHEGGQV